MEISDKLDEIKKIIGQTVSVVLAAYEHLVD